VHEVVFFNVSPALPAVRSVLEARKLRGRAYLRAPPEGSPIPVFSGNYLEILDVFLQSELDVSIDWNRALAIFTNLKKGIARGRRMALLVAGVLSTRDHESVEELSGAVGQDVASFYLQNRPAVFAVSKLFRDAGTKAIPIFLKGDLRRLIPQKYGEATSEARALISNAFYKSDIFTVATMSRLLPEFLELALERSKYAVAVVRYKTKKRHAVKAVFYGPQWWEPRKYASICSVLAEEGLIAKARGAKCSVLLAESVGKPPEEAVWKRELTKLVQWLEKKARR
jgi:hypothetical protein